MVNNAKSIFENVEKPALARTVMTFSKAGVYVMRICKGRDIKRKRIYVVQVKNIFGSDDNFTETYTKTFYKEHEARKHYKLVRGHAFRHEKKLRERAERRAQEWINATNAKQ